MQLFSEPAKFKQQVATFFNQRTNYDNEGNYHLALAHRLIEHAHICQGQKILDIATGTGMVAIKAAQLVAPDGWVVGVDISMGMLAQAKRKIEALQLANLSLQLVDAEALNFPDHCFDVILCSSALPYMTDIPAALCLWHRFLKPGGTIGFHGFSDTSFVAGVVLRLVANRYGIPLVFNQPTDAPEKCYSLLQSAGFEAIAVQAEQFGSYITLEEAKRVWNPLSKNPMMEPLRQLSPEQLQQAQSEFFAELEALVTNQGIWNNILAFFALGRKG